ncbi:MAG: hypothetical protein AAFX57_16180 [Bacteroidota bacterium]
MSTKLEMDERGRVSEIPLGYWRRGDGQYWHIKEDSALLINLPRKGFHYDGDGSYIFFKWPDSTISYNVGRVSCTKEEFDKARRHVIKRLADY